MNLHELNLDQLDELEPRAAEDLGRSIAETLTVDPPSEFNNRLIRATQFLHVEDPAVREALSKSLFHAARLLRDRGLSQDSQTLWAAIRMAAVFHTTPAGLATLTDFMRPGGAHETLQVSLQAISNVSCRGPQPIVPELRGLADAVQAAANRFCQFELLAVPAVAALAISAVAAARAMALPGVDGWIAEFKRRPLLLGQLERKLEGLTEQWSELHKGLRTPAGAPPLRNASAVREWLQLPTHRQLTALEGNGGTQLLEWVVAELDAREAELTESQATLERLRAESQRHRDSADKDLEEAWDNHLELMEEAPGRGRRRDRKSFDQRAFELPRYPRLTIGQEFKNPDSGHRFRVTDVGLRSFVTIDLTACEQSHPGDPSWLHGPPYAIPETVWDEYDFGSLEGVPGIEWASHGAAKSLNRLLDAVRIFATDWKLQDGCNGKLIDDVVATSEKYWGPLV